MSNTFLRDLGGGAILLVSACGAADPAIDPDALDTRDLLGVDPAVVAGWTDDARAQAQAVLLGALDREPPEGEWIVPIQEQALQAEGLAGVLTEGLRVVDDARAERRLAPVLVTRASAGQGSA